MARGEGEGVEVIMFARRPLVMLAPTLVPCPSMNVTTWLLIEARTVVWQQRRIFVSVVSVHIVYVIMLKNTWGRAINCGDEVSPNH